MHYFSIHTQSGEHLGFFIMLADDETEQPPQSERFAVKLQSEAPPQDQAAVQALSAWQLADTPLLWAAEKDYVALFGGDKPSAASATNFSASAATPCCSPTSQA